jgi:hypothetical protein
MLHDDPADPRAPSASLPCWSIRVRLNRAYVEACSPEELAQASLARSTEVRSTEALHAQVRQRLADAGIAAIGADVARGGIVVPVAPEDIRQELERVLSPLAEDGLLTIEARPLDVS